MNDLLEIVASLRYWMTDWDGRTMGDDELPLDGLHCGLLRQSAELISQQDAELERLQALYDREKAAHRISVDEAIAEARKAAFIEAAEIAQNITSAECREIISEEKWVDMTDDYGEHIGQMKQGACFRLNFRKGIAAALRAKAEGENHG